VTEPVGTRRFTYTADRNSGQRDFCGGRSMGIWENGVTSRHGFFRNISSGVSISHSNPARTSLPYITNYIDSHPSLLPRPSLLLPPSAVWTLARWFSLQLLEKKKEKKRGRPLSYITNQTTSNQTAIAGGLYYCLGLIPHHYPLGTSSGHCWHT